MRSRVFVPVPVVAPAGVVAAMVPALEQADRKAAPNGINISIGYRDGRLITVATKKAPSGLRGILGNDDNEMHAALEVDIANYATAIADTNQVIDSVSSFQPWELSAQ